MIGGTNKKSGIALGIAIAGVAFAGATPASAADLSGGAYADLEERIAELEATTARKGNRKVSLTVSGLVNEALLFWDDGSESNVYVGTNEAAQSRFRVLGEAEITKGWKAGYLIEIGVRGARLDRVNQNEPTTSSSNAAADFISTRHSAWWLSSKDYGKLWVGLTSDAADGITEINLANTNHFASANKQNLGDGGSGFFLRRNGALLDGTGGNPNLKWGNFVVPGGQQGIPGEGHRENLVKYETPTFAGFTASAAWGEDDFWNIALRYKGEGGGFKFAGGIAYTEVGDASKNTWRRGAGDTEEFGLSASVLHTETGLYVTGAYGHLEDDGVADFFAAANFDPDNETDYYFIQAGIERKFFPVGKTTIFGEYWNLERGAGVSINSSNVVSALSFGAGTVVSGSTIEGWGIGLNQNFSEFFDLYVLYNHVSLDATSVNTATGVTSSVNGLDDFDYVLAGGQIKF